VSRQVLLSWPFGCPIEKVAPVMRLASARGLGKLMARVPPSRAATKALLRQIGLRQAVDSGGFDDVALDWFHSLLRDTPTMRNEIDAIPGAVRPLKGVDERLLLTDDLLARVVAPTYFLWGSDDPQGGRATAEAFAARLPHAELEMFDGAGHAPWMDDPARVASCVGAFLAA
jgi:pimeloyl-ACP methyl ester carboxylesterase